MASLQEPLSPVKSKPDTAHIEDALRPDSIEKNDLSALEAGTANPKNELTVGLFMTMLGFSMAFVAAEVVPLFLITLFTIIAYSLNASAYVVWIIVSQFIAIGAVAPFVGTLADLLGRKVIVLVGLALTVVSMIIIGTTLTITGMIAGMVLAGVGIGIQLLTSIAAVTELVPTSKRGITVGYVVCGFMPFAPASLYGQYMAAHNWRWVSVLVGIWAVIAFIVLAIFYNPPPRPNAEGLSKRNIIGRIDFVGIFLSLAGIIIFLTGLNWGGQSYRWRSAHVIGTMVAGGLCIVVFFIWERFGAKYPMFPIALARAPRPFMAVCILALTSGINYIPLVFFWTIQVYTVYEASFHQAGVFLLPIGFCIAGGAIISAALMSIFKKHIPLILFIFCVLQTAGLGSMAAVNPENINTVWAPMVIALLGVGGVLLPTQVVFSILTPDFILGSGVALSISIRMIGQVVGVSMFYNIFLHHVNSNALKYFALPAIEAGFDSVAEITALATALTAGPLQSYAHLFPQFDGTDGEAKIQSIVAAGHELFKHCFPILYFISIAFGGAAIVSSFFLRDINHYIDEHVAVLL